MYSSHFVTNVHLLHGDDPALNEVTEPTSQRHTATAAVKLLAIDCFACMYSRLLIFCLHIYVSSRFPVGILEYEYQFLLWKFFNRQLEFRLPIYDKRLDSLS